MTIKILDGIRQTEKPVLTFKDLPVGQALRFPHMGNYIYMKMKLSSGYDGHTYYAALLRGNGEIADEGIMYPDEIFSNYKVTPITLEATEVAQ